MSQTPYDARLEAVDDEESADQEIQAQREQIEQTRAEMSGTIDAIKDRLSPQNLVEQAKDTVYGATVGRAQEAMGTAMDTARETMDNVGERITSSTIYETIRENPIPAAMVAVGLGWLFMSGRRQRSDDTRSIRHYDYDRGYGASSRGGYPSYESQPGYRGYQQPQTYYPPAYSGEQTGAAHTAPQSGQGPGVAGRVGEAVGDVRERVGEVAGQARETVGRVAGEARETVGRVAGEVQERAGEMAERTRYQANRLSGEARYQAERAMDGTQRFIQENPIAASCVALGLGAALGLLLPETNAENRMMGDTRERFVDRAQEVAQQAGEKAQAVAHRAVDTVKQEVQEQNLGQKVQNVAREAWDTTKQEAKNAARDVAASASGGTTGGAGMTTGADMAGGTKTVEVVEVAAVTDDDEDTTTTDLGATRSTL
jgi:ElaB/YqjD/DUF883 family membrane-anchored ribosome-binding protein